MFRQPRFNITKVIQINSIWFRIASSPRQSFHLSSPLSVSTKTEPFSNVPPEPSAESGPIFVESFYVLGPSLFPHKKQLLSRIPSSVLDLSSRRAARQGTSGNTKHSQTSSQILTLSHSLENSLLLPWAQGGAETATAEVTTR